MYLENVNTVYDFIVYIQTIVLKLDYIAKLFPGKT